MKKHTTGFAFAVGMLIAAMCPCHAAPACGGHNQAACKPDPAKGKDRPYCTERGTVALWSTYAMDISTDDKVRQIEGWCWRLDPQCGTAAGKPCCPDFYKQGATPAPNTPKPTNAGCNGNNNDNVNNPKGALYCKVDKSHPATIKYFGGGASESYRAGTCIANAPDCGQTGKSCCYWESGCCAVAKCLKDSDKCDDSGGNPGKCVPKTRTAPSGCCA